MKLREGPEVLSALPSTRRHRRQATAFVLVSAAVCAALIPFASIRLGEVPSFIPAYQSAIIACELVTVALILGQLRAVPSRGLLILAAGYLFSAMMAFVHLLSFPGAFSARGLLGAGPQTTAYLFVLWHIGFPLFAVGYALTRDQIVGPVQSTTLVAVAVGVAALVLGCVVLTTFGSALLPPMLDGAVYSTRFNIGRHGQWVVVLTAIVILWRRKPHSVLDVWLIATLFMWWFEIALVGIFNSGRWDVGFYAGRVYSLLGATVILIMLLAEQSGVYASLLRAFYEARNATRLRESEERFKTVANSAPVLIWMNDHTGCVFLNRAYLEFVGIAQSADVQGYDWTRFIHADDRERCVTAYAAAFESGSQFEAEFRFRRHDGEYRWVRAVAVPRLTRTGELLGYTGCTFDVHEERQAADALRRADRQKDEFIATLAHELRNPLAPLANGLEVLERVGGCEPREVAVREMMSRQVRHLRRLVDDLLDVSRITQGKIVLERETVALQTLVREAVETVRPAAELRGHVVHVSLPDVPLYACVDATRLVQVLVNLLNNAVKFTPAGGEIEVTLRQSDTNAQIDVSDTGAGIPPEQLASVFQMFAQPVPALERHEGGLGIGLALVKSLIELHGGTVEAQSAGTGYGSRFRIRLPLGVPDVAASRSSSAADAGDPVPLRVLVVDDNRDAASTLRELLESGGHSVREAHDGVDGVRIAREFQPDAVILDLGMPGMNGYEAARAIRAESRRLVRLVALSGWASPSDRKRAIEAGFDAHLTKPCDANTIERALRG